MSHTSRTVAVLVLAAAAAQTAGSSAPLRYRVTAVRGKLLRLEPGPKERIAAGVELAPGTVLRTGWWSSARIETPAAAARFRVGARTTVRLAEERAGVLLEVTRGRLRAVFDKLTGGAGPARAVATPSAVLAVRGTEYGVAVARSGETAVVVFEGTVEVARVDGRGTPVMVTQGQFTTVARGQAPHTPMEHGMSAGDWDHGRMPGAMGGSGMGEMMPGASHSGGRHGGGSMRHGG